MFTHNKAATWKKKNNLNELYYEGLAWPLGCIEDNLDESFKYEVKYDIGQILQLL